MAATEIAFAEVRFSAGSGVRSVLKQAADVLPVEDGSARGAEAFVFFVFFIDLQSVCKHKSLEVRWINRFHWIHSALDKINR